MHRTAEEGERTAWAALRSGDPAMAMAHYRARGALSFSDTRVEAVDRAAQRYLELASEHGPARVALMTDASNAEVDALNLRIQVLRSQRGELGGASIELPGSGHRLHVEDRVTLTRAVFVDAEPRVENGVRGRAIAVHGHGARLQLDGSDRIVDVAPVDLDALRLGYAGHVFREQGATVERAIVVTGGWQTSREGAYVGASRAREGAEWHVAREELDGDDDAERIDQLAARMRVSRAQEPSLDIDLAGPGVETLAELRVEHLVPEL